MTKSGGVVSRLPKCKLFDVMRFFLDRISCKPSESSMPSTCIRVSMDDKPISLCSSPSPLSCSAPSPLTPDAIGASPLPKKHRPDIQKMDEQFFPTTKTMNDNLIASIPHSGETREICEDAMYCKSLFPLMKGLPVKKKRLTRMKLISYCMT